MFLFSLLTGSVFAAGPAARERAWQIIAPAFTPPVVYSNDFGTYTSPLKRADGSLIRTAEEWQQRRKGIREHWMQVMGPWPPLLQNPRLVILSSTNRDGYTEQAVNVQVAAYQSLRGYLLSPTAEGKLPAVLVPFYEPETSIGRTNRLRDFALQLTRRGFVTLSIGSPGGDARAPDLAGARCQPLSYLAYIAANCHTALTLQTNVDPARIGVVGHSYGGKWAMFASCLYDKFACAAWSDPGIVFDESRPNVNYWDDWYLGLEPGKRRPPGTPSLTVPRSGAYKTLFESGHDLHELHVLMAPRPFLVSGGAEDQPERWRALNATVAVNSLLGATNRVAMTNRATHSPTEESNEALFAFLEHFLK